jgi:hypothetical protein
MKWFSLRQNVWKLRVQSGRVGTSAYISAYAPHGHSFPAGMESQRTRLSPSPPLVASPGEEASRLDLLRSRRMHERGRRTRSASCTRLRTRRCSSTSALISTCCSAGSTDALTTKGDEGV